MYDEQANPDGDAGPDRARHELLPLTPAQRGMWFADRLSPDYSVNIAQYVDIRHQPGGFDIELFMDCSYEVGRELETPYIRLTEVDGVPMQYVDVDYDQKVDLIDFRGNPDPLDEAKAWMNDEFRRPVDLINDQLIVVAILRVADDHTIWYQRAHHLIIDGYAAFTNMRRLLDRYNARRRGEELKPKLMLNLAGIVEYEESYRDSGRRETDREHWLQRVRDLPERVTLSRTTATAPLSFGNLVAGAPLPSELQRQLDQLARETSSSIAAVLTAAFSAFLSRMTGSDDVVLSLPITGRANAKIKNSGGMVSNVLPVRITDFSGATVREVIGAALLEMTGALRHQRYRTEDIRRDAGLDGNSMGFGPVINMVLFDAPIEIDGTDLEYRILSSGVLEDLFLNLYQSGPGAPLVVDVHGNPHLYRQDELDEHHRRFIEFLARFAADAEQRIDALDLLLPGELTELCGFEAGPHRDWTAEETGDGHLLDLFATRVRSAPAAIAVVDGDESWTYREFDLLRRKAAEWMRDQGVRAGDRVAIAVPRSVGQVAAIYGALTLGAAFVPVDPELPADRCELILATASPRLVVDQEALHDSGLTVKPSAGESRPERAVEFATDAAAYVIFTSGSTGTPKGVQVSHRALLNRLAWVQQDFPIGADDTWLYKTPFTFDPSVIELLWPLQQGATMVIAKPGGHRDPAYLAELIAERAVTTLHFVPSMLDVFAEGLDSQTLAAVRRLFVSGEALLTALAERVGVLSDAQIVNLYGPTEAAVDVTQYVVQPGDQQTPIGVPVANTGTMVLDSRLRRQPVGVAGELYLSGVQLADGYVGSPGLTAERFVADPFDDGARLYRTGDLVRWNDRGQIEYLGRTDFQVKIRGQRVELGEIEATLLADDSVVGAVVMVDESGSSLNAFVRLSDTDGPDGFEADRLRRLCTRHLPGHMVPAAVMVLDAFPVNASGKLDRRALPVPTPVILQGATEFIPPESEAEVLLAELISELLGVERIGMRDNIFHLGADSLTAARLAARARTTAGLDLALGAIFASDSVADLAVAARPVVGGSALPALVRMERPDLIPLSYPQTRLWFINRVEPESPAYNMPGAVRLPADLDVDALELALADLLVRHESLRTLFPSVDGEPVQEILSPEKAQFALRRAAAVADEVLAVVTAEVMAGFDLTVELPVRFSLVTVVEDGQPSGYVLLTVLHHIAGDGASLVPLIGDLLTAYAARAAGTVPVWDALPIQYADFTLWQREVLGDPADEDSQLGRELAYWTGQLADLPEKLALPVDSPRTSPATGAGAFVDTELSDEALTALRRLAREAQVTPFTVLHGALAALLARVANTDDVAIGTAVAGRDHPEVAGLIGMFVNTVVLRTRVRPGDTIGDVLRHAHEVRTSALEHSSAPFEAIVEAVGHPRSMTHSPLFQVAFTMIADHQNVLAGSGVEALEARPEVAKYDLAITATQFADGAVSLEFSYATDVFERDTVQRLSDYLERLLIAMAVDTARPVGRIALLSGEEIAQVADRSDKVEPRTFRELLQEMEIRAEPKQPALIGSEVVSNEAFGMRSNQLARELIARGVGPGDVVAVAMPRSELSVLASVAVAKTGAAFVSIDPRHPADRRAMMLSTSGARVGLTVTGVELSGHDWTEWIVVDNEATELHLAGRSGRPISDTELVRIAALDDAAYLIFTSGSTGLPKATAVPHRGLANLLDNQRRRLALNAGSRVLHVASPSFDASVFELLMALAANGSLVVADVHTYAGRDLERFIARHRVTHAVMTPSALSTVDPRNVPSLQCVLSAGEACPPELMRRWAASGCRFFNLYGPTEATIWATVDGPLRAADEITIGRPIDGVGALVLDTSLQVTPLGVLGELYLTGDQLALGYLDRAGQTAGAFVANPFEPGRRMYRTGDMVIRRADGRLTYRGRGDFQLKVRGMRIEPGEVDAVLAVHPAVANALSLGVKGPGGESVLVSYVSPVDGATITSAELHRHATELLPAHLVPSAITVVDEFPTTVVGKIDRSRLPEVEFTRSAAYLPPRNEMESVVAEVFAQVLDVDQVGAHDSFFDLGGTSLSAAKLATSLSRVLDRTVSVKTVFEGSTVAGVAAAIASLSIGVASPELVARPRAELVPVSDVQRGMWLLNQADPASAAYNIAMALRFQGALDLAALKAACADLVERQEALRTIYPMVGGRPVQLIERADKVVAGLDLVPVAVQGDLAERVAEITGEGFDVTTQPPLRIAILALGEDDHVIVFVIHHISADGASIAPLAHDFMTAYMARHSGHGPHWLPLPVQYADFAVWQEERLELTDGDGVSQRERQLDYWRERLSGAPETMDLPADRSRPATASYAGAVVDFEIPSELAEQLHQVARRFGASLFMVTHAALTVLLARLGGHGDVVIGTPYAGRGEAALDDIVGMFVNTLALRTRVDPGEPFGDLLQRVRTDDLTDMANTDVSFDSVATAIGAQRTSAVNPVFQVMFTFQNLEFPSVALDDVTITPVSEELSAAKVDLQLTLFPNDPAALGAGEKGAGMRAQFLYATDLFDETSVQRYAERYRQVLEAIAADPEVLVGDISIATVAERASIASAKTARTLNELVAAAAVSSPESIAISEGGMEVTFSTLSVTATAMAAALPDADAALTTAVMSLAPMVAAGGPERLGEVFAELRRRAEAAIEQIAYDEESVQRP
ncbi:MAG: amino acid adenylation domain-containing protein [Gordonia sp. (in: high G+C Gram-positive bacteria)]|uniref:amino acid adenylation domain-containing protein n=1 Tax=Gordonia sp. (in: high G+C Gram-positive bacteria) TaxID=84139 RepID=UPI003BB5A5F5